MNRIVAAFFVGRGAVLLEREREREREKKRTNLFFICFFVLFRTRFSADNGPLARLNSRRRFVEFFGTSFGLPGSFVLFGFCSGIVCFFRLFFFCFLLPFCLTGPSLEPRPTSESACGCRSFFFLLPDWLLPSFFFPSLTELSVDFFFLLTVSNKGTGLFFIDCSAITQNRARRWFSVETVFSFVSNVPSFFFYVTGFCSTCSMTR